MKTKIFAIREKSTGDFISFNSRCAWTKAGNAKNAWSGKTYLGKRVKFDEQDEYEIVELTEFVFMYEGLCK